MAPSQLLLSDPHAAEDTMDEDSDGFMYESDLSDDFMNDDDDDEDDQPLASSSATGGTGGGKSGNSRGAGAGAQDDDDEGLDEDDDEAAFIDGDDDGILSPGVADDGDAGFFGGSQTAAGGGGAGGMGISGGKKASYEVDYKSHTLQTIVALQKKEIDQISAMFNVKDTDAAILLRHMSWNKERLIERYMDAPDDVKYEAGVMDDPARPRIVDMRPADHFTCEICFTSTDDLAPTSETPSASAATASGKSPSKGKGKAASPASASAATGPALSTLALGCGHRFCKDCYAEYLLRKIQEEGESRRVQCMEERCKLVVDERTVGLLVPPEVLEKYQLLLNRTFIDDSGIMRWCPAPNCELAVECHVSIRQLNRIVPTVRCGAGHEFCFGCGHDSHAPAVCPLVKLWLKKCADDSETSNWIKANTKDCPNPACSSTIEKSGGCNHMTCRKCKYEFCWMCEGEWKIHGTSWYNCNRYDPKKANDAQNKSRISLERYLHYYNRYVNHEQSARLDENLVAQTQKSMDAMQEAGVLTWSEVQFLKQAAATVTECRITLKWTYAMAYYLKNDPDPKKATPSTILFEDNQRDLERAVEELSEQLQKPVEKSTIHALRQKVIDLMVYVSKRREIVLSDTAAGFSEGRWEWNVDVGF